MKVYLYGYSYDSLLHKYKHWISKQRYGDWNAQQRCESVSSCLVIMQMKCIWLISGSGIAENVDSRMQTRVEYPRNLQKQNVDVRVASNNCTL